MNRKQLAEMFAAQSKPTGKASSLSFHGNTLFSYSTSIAVIHGRHAILATRRYSVTTSSHQWAARRALLAAGLTVYDVDTIATHEEACRAAGLTPDVPPPILADQLLDRRR